MNIDTDTQWSYWSGIKEFEAKNRPYLQTQIGNPDGPDKPNKKYYDPRSAPRRQIPNPRLFFGGMPAVLRRCRCSHVRARAPCRGQ